MNTDADFAIAETRVLDALLLEICEALVVGGALTRDDIAGALLRAEATAEVLDEVAAEDGDITGHHVGLAGLATERWNGRFRIEPSLYALRKLNNEAQARGLPRRALLSAREVVEHFRDDDEHDAEHE